jgi:RNA polymerase sigma-70 factor (ECF subfamily)
MMQSRAPRGIGRLFGGGMPSSFELRRMGRCRYGRSGNGGRVDDSWMGARAVDARLVDRLADGDESALSELYDGHSEAVMGLAMRMLRNRAEAEDLVHDIFVEAWRTAARYDSARGSVRTWLLVKTRARAIDRIRSPRLSRRVGELPSNGRGPVEQPTVENRSDSVRAVAALDGLPPAQRAVLELAYLAGLSSTEISDRLGIPVGTVKSRAAAGLRKLRAALASPMVGAGGAA